MAKTIKNNKSNKSNKINKSNKTKKKSHKIQSGGAINIFDITDGIKTVAAYCYTKEKSTGQYYFGFVRKLQENGRIRYNINSTNTGAAGTKPKFMGKWTSVGGSTGKKKTTYFKAVINELNDETNSQFNSITDIDISEFYQVKKIINQKLILKDVQLGNNAYIFSFEIPDNNIFFNIYPKQGMTTPKLLTSSEGEIDAIQSYSMSDIMNLQSTNNNNYFIYYCIDNFNKFVKPLISNLSPVFKQNWSNDIPVNDDNNARIPNELTHAPYKEIKGNKYIADPIIPTPAIPTPAIPKPAIPKPAIPTPAIPAIPAILAIPVHSTTYCYI